MKGRFITFEGPEGSGKSTQVKLLIERLTGSGIRVLPTREPGGTRTGEVIRNLLQHDLAQEPMCPATEVLLFAASRAQLVACSLAPALAEGQWVVCDRFMDSTTAYQGYGRGFDVERMVEISRFAVGDTVPDRTILLDLEVDASLKRMQARNAQRQQGQDRFERETRDFHERIRNGYLQLAQRWPERIRVIKSDRPVATVHGDVWAALADLVPAVPGAGAAE